MAGINLGSILQGLAGAGSPQGYFGPQQTEQRRERAVDKSEATEAFATLKQYAQQQEQDQQAQGGDPSTNTGPTPLQKLISGGAPPQPGTAPQPGGLNSPQGGPVSIQRPAQPMPQGGQPAMARPQPAPQMPAQAPQQGGKAPDPMQQLYKMIDAVASDNNIPPEQKMGVLAKIQAFQSPFEKYTQQLEVKAQQLTMQQQMLDEKMRNQILLQQMRDATSVENTGARVGATERGQDINAANVNKRVGAAERGQDIRADIAEDAQSIAQQRADTAASRTGAQNIQGEEGLKIKQQNADTASDRAGTYKYGTMAKDKRAGEALDFKKLSLKEKNDLILRGQDKQYQERMAGIAARGKPESQTEFKAAQAEFTQASADYRNAKMSLNSTPADIQAQADKALAAQQKMEQAAAKGQTARAPAQPVDIQRDGTPDPAQLSDKEQKSFDGGKTWWHLENGKPVKSE